MSFEKAYSVRGMMCRHCEQSVREEVERVPGVCAADVDHRSGRLVVMADELLSDDAIGEAVVTAGFELVAPDGTDRS